MILIILFCVLLFFPLYTYIFYPIILKALPKKHWKEDVEYYPFTSVLFLDDEKEQSIDWNKKIGIIDYPKEKLEFIRVNSIRELNKKVRTLRSEIIVITDRNSAFDPTAIHSLVMMFTDESVGCVVGIQKKGSENRDSDNGLLWRYEYFVRRSESKIGCVSGVNNTLYAVRKKCFPDIPENILNIGFYVATNITMNGYNVVLSQKAVSYDFLDEKATSRFLRHIRDAQGYWQSLGIFWNGFSSRKGWFVYVSHRVLKWFVPFDLVLLLTINIFCLRKSPFFVFFFFLQIFCYIIGAAGWIDSRKPRTLIQKLVHAAGCFFELNVAYIVGLLKK